MHDKPAPENFSYSTWKIAFENLAHAVSEKEVKPAIILDEFTYALASDPSLASVLQNAWDHLFHFKKLPILLIISGSHIGMMERETMSYRAPLYGRATARLKLSPLPFKHLKSFFPNYDITERVAIYAIMGGIPYYLEQLNPNLSVSENIKTRVLEGKNVLQQEPRLLLHEEVDQLSNYIGILQAIANGSTRMSKIASTTGIAENSISKYLSTMVNLGLVERHIPATVKHANKSRRGRYAIVDPYLRFYYRFVHPQLPSIATGMTAPVIENVKNHMISFIGRYAFEELCRNWVLIAGGTKQLPFYPQNVGAHWSSKEQIDVAAVNWESHDVLFGECKWGTSQRLGISVVEKLIRQAQNAKPKSAKGKPFKVHYAFFSRAGFTPQASKKIKEINGIAVDLARFESVLELAIR